MPNSYNQQPDIQLIPYHEFDPEIHNIEYRYFETPEFQTALNQLYANTYNQEGQVSGDFRSYEDARRPYYGRPRPFYPPFVPFFPPFYGGGYGYHPYGGGYFHPYGGYGGGYGGHGGYHSGGHR